jgi:hypothetical protein
MENAKVEVKKMAELTDKEVMKYNPRRLLKER